MGLGALAIAACGDNEVVVVTPDGGVAVLDLSVPAVPDGAVSPASVRLTETNLVSDQTAVAANTDPNLVNAWGLAIGPTGVIWIAANGTGTARLVNADGTPNSALPAVTIPGPPGATAASTPTGTVFNGNAALFKGDAFIFVTEDGTISGWQMSRGNTAAIEVDNSAGADHPVYKGATMATANGVTHLFVTDFHNARIAVFDSNFMPVAVVTGAFTDPNLPAGFAPFNVSAIGTRLFVTFAKQNAERHDDVAGIGNGFVDTFDFNGGTVTRLISGGVLNSPWGLAVTPANFGNASNMLLVGNFGDGRIHAYNIESGSLTATFTNSAGTEVVIDGLWSLVFGAGLTGEATNTLFFTAGPVMETHGLFGTLIVAQ
jgi:uncharacterized protein (TIGR03118 family)